MFRLFSVYIILYILFISDFISNFFGEAFPILQNVKRPFNFIANTFMNLINSLFIHRNSVDTSSLVPDFYWAYIAALSLFLMSIIISLLWTIFDKRKNHQVLFGYVHAIARYYLAFILSFYGITKLFGFQFEANSQNALLYSLPDLSPHQLFWSFMGVSKSYQFFGGLLEIIPAILLVFRRTATLGSIIAIAVLLNVLMLDIGYDTPLKLFLFHLIIIALYILSHDLKKLFNLFVLKQTTALATIVPVFNLKRLKWLYIILKSGLICGFIFLELKSQIAAINETNDAPHSLIAGIHKITEFQLSQDSSSKGRGNQLDWKKIALPSDAYRFSVQFSNDSIATYFLKSNPASESMEFVSKEDSSYKIKLDYTRLKSDKWQFTGTIKKDSVRFISTKINLNKSNLLKDYGKAIWVY